jgi:cell division ATPase FtsA
LSPIFNPNLTIYGDKNDVMIVMVPTMEKTTALVAPTSASPFAVSKASAPPDAEESNAVCIDVLLLNLRF